MTGYGFFQLQLDDYRVEVEIRSVNHRHQEIRVHLEQAFRSWEKSLYDLIKEALSRGRVDLYLTVSGQALEYEVKVDLNLARGYHQAWKSLEEELGLDEDHALSFLCQQEDLFQIRERERHDSDLEENIMSAARGALDNLLEMRKEEGRQLAEDLKSSLAEMSRLLVAIEERSPLVTEEYRQRLTERLSALTEGSFEAPDEERLAFEVAIMAEKSDISEELARIKSHLNQFEETVEQASPVGRKLDFIAQELHREVNTIGSKAKDSLIAEAVIEMKSEIDQLREQAKNIE